MIHFLWVLTCAFLSLPHLPAEAAPFGRPPQSSDSTAESRTASTWPTQPIPNRSDTKPEIKKPQSKTASNVQKKVSQRQSETPSSQSDIFRSGARRPQSESPILEAAAELPARALPQQVGPRAGLQALLPDPVGPLHPLSNLQLREQIALQPWRLLPQGETYSLALDGFLFKPFGDNDVNYYHGNGYWVSGLLEYRPYPALDLNLKIAAYNGASSYGYAESSLLRHFFGVTWHPDSESLPVDIFVRYFDLGRQTLGAGLTLEERELAGVWSEIRKDALRYKLLISGTGGFFTTGDLFYHQIDLWENRIGASFTHFSKVTFPVRDPNGDIIGFRDQEIDPFVTFYSLGHLSNRLAYAAELGVRNGASAWKAALAHASQWTEKFGGEFVGQIRYYNAGFGEDITRRMEQGYVTPDQYDVPYTNILNIFQIDDNVRVYSLQANLKYRVTDRIALRSQNEIGSFHYLDRNRFTALIAEFDRIDAEFDDFIFHKQSVVFQPYPERPDFLSVYVGNKALRSRGPIGFIHGSEPLFVNRPIVGLDARFYF